MASVSSQCLLFDCLPHPLALICRRPADSQLAFGLKMLMIVWQCVTFIRVVGTLSYLLFRKFCRDVAIVVGVSKSRNILSMDVCFDRVFAVALKTSKRVSMALD